MRILLPSVLLLLWGTLCPSTRAWSLNNPSEDLEASGDDLEMDGSGSGEGPGDVITERKVNDLGKSKEVTVSSTNQNNGGPTEFQTPDQPWNRENIIVRQSKSFMESKEVLAGIIAGGVVGLALAVLVAGILIYQWQKKDEAEYVQGQQQRDQIYHRDTNGTHRREEIVMLV